MRDKVNRPEKSFAFLKAGTALAVAAALSCGPISAKPARAFEIFGMKFFEDKEETTAVIDPVTYTLTLDPGTDDSDLVEAIENTARLKQDEDKPVSGDLGLVIKARDDRDRILAALYENARYGAVVNVTVNGQDLDTLPPNPEFSQSGPIPVTISVQPGPVFTFGEIAFSGDAEGRNPADYGLVPGARADSGSSLSNVARNCGSRSRATRSASGRALMSR